ncbi:MAG: glucose-6-phosphate isomerase [Pleomorphochaeta sp.]
MEYKNFTQLKSFKKLKDIEPFDLKSGLNKDRIEKYQTNNGTQLNYSYATMPINDKHLELFQELSEEQSLIEKYKLLLNGERINTGENRCVLHQLTRGQLLNDVEIDGENKGEFYKSQLNRIKDFSNKVRNGEIVGSTNKKFDTVVQIGIGGSDLGPRALYLALKGYVAAQDKQIIDAKFISNVDPDDVSDVTKDIDFETTLFVLVSKSGTTQETLTNKDLVFDTLKSCNIEGFIPSKHMIAVTSKTSPLADSDEVLDAFFIDDYIGGRYSSTSAVGGVILSISLGFETFNDLLKGANEADKNALNENVVENAALLDAMIGVYLRNSLNLPSTAVLPYSQALSRFPAHLQQLDMESNGKHVNRFGEDINYSTGPVILGEPGTNGQHSFYQLLHQGTDIIPLQFIGFKKSQFEKDIVVDKSTSQEKLNANLTAQIVAFAIGKDDENPNKVFEGNRYSSLISANQLTPSVLGALLAHFENKVMFQGFIWNLNSFDQEGVQLGKILAKKVLNGCEGDELLIAYSSLLNN